MSYSQQISHDELMKIFLSRLRTQSRYYPNIDLVFPPRFIGKIFADSNSNPWTNWMRNEILSMKFFKQNGSVEFRDVKYIEILNDNSVSVFTWNHDPFKLYTNSRNGLRPLVAKNGLKDLSIDHVISMNEYFQKNHLKFKGLKRISNIMRLLNEKAQKDHLGSLDLRNELSWYNNLFEFLKENKPEIIADLQRLFAEDFKILHFDYEIMERQENVVKGNLSSIPANDESQTKPQNDIFQQGPKTDKFKNEITKLQARRLLNLGRIDTLASINKTIPSYWANPKEDLLKDEWILVLNDYKHPEGSRKLHLFKIPANSVKGSQFKLRKDRPNLLDIRINHEFNNPDFEDWDGFKFKPFLIKTIQY